jgi:LacI family transcriptional regulator
VNVHKEELGKEAVDRILWRLNHPDEPMKNTVLNVEVVERDSVKKDSGKKD